MKQMWTHGIACMVLKGSHPLNAHTHYIRAWQSLDWDSAIPVGWSQNPCTSACSAFRWKYSSLKSQGGVST
jgi:hypothetical protein